MWLVLEINQSERGNMENNEKLKKMLHEKKIPLWKVGARLGLCENTIQRWLRVPMSEEKESRLIRAIFEIAAEKEGRKK